jgi:CRP-like cAMP-binding protein
MPTDVPAKIDEFFSHYRARTYTKGQVLIFSGDRSAYTYQLISGKVKVYDVTPRGDEVILNIFKTPAFFPVSMALNNTPNPYIYEAETDVVLRQAPNEDVLKFLQGNPDVVMDLLARVYRGVDGILGRVAVLMSGTAKDRLMYELLIEARRFGKQFPDGSCMLDASEKEIGARAGLSRETVSREVRGLKNDGLIAVVSKRITILNVENLKARLAKSASL